MKKISAFCLAALFFLSCSTEQPVQFEQPGTYLPPSALDTAITLVTLNMAVGFDAENMLTQDLTKPQVVFDQGKLLYDEFLKSVPRERVRVLADSIARIAPDVVALQEVLYLVNHLDSQSFDFLGQLLSEIDSLGGPSYGVVRQVLNPIPVKVAVSGPGGPDSLDFYFREGNALLYKTASLTFVSADSICFFLGIRNQPYLNATTISILRGAVFAKLRTAKGTIFNVINTHLEVDALPTVGSGQAMELRDYIRGLSLGSEATAVLGDFNDVPTGSRVGKILGDNFIDTYADTGLTCCFDIVNAGVPATRRIDYILARGIVKTGDSRTGLNGTFVSDTALYRISDHAGVIAALTFH